MKSQIKKKEIIILFLLLWFLIGSLIVMYVIFPMADEFDTAEEELYFNQYEYQNMIVDSDMISDIEEENKKLEDDILEELSFLYEPMTTEEADIMLQKIFRKYNVSSESFTVIESEPIEKSEYFSVSETKKDTTSSDEKEESQSLMTTGIKIMLANYTLSGEYNDILKIINEINKMPAVTIQNIEFKAEKEAETSFSITTDNSSVENNDISQSQMTKTQFNMTFILFMK